MKNNTFSIVIPAYNEDSYIYKLITTILSKYPDEHIIVVDDGSDNFINFNHKNVFIVRNENRLGKGLSILKGIDKSLSLGASFSIVIDGDMQHDCEYIQKFIEESIDVDLVLGYRELSKPMPFYRILSNRITTAIISFISKVKIKDSQCGFRRYKNSFLKKYAFKEKGFQFESEVLLKLNRETRLSQIPIKTIYNDSKSHMNIIYDTLKFIKLILRHIFNE